MKGLKFYSTALFWLIAFFGIAQQKTDQPIRPERQFDFWIGEWDVNLRTLQEDASWKDSHQAVAKIYSILDGQVILELWEETSQQPGIIGYSLRYYDHDKGQWVLWLNWPGKNRSGSSMLQGKFRHGRGDFLGERRINDSTTRISKFTFSDITDYSLRWDDAYSVDGGKTWTYNWIMEFSRIRQQPNPLVPGKGNHTNDVENRCNGDSFDIIQKLSSLKYLKNASGDLSFYGILEGCAVISHIKESGFESYSILTYNTYANIYEELVLTGSATPIMFYGPMKDGSLRLTAKDTTSIRNWQIENSTVTIDSGSEMKKFE